MFTSTILFGMKLYLINRIQYSLPYNENRAEQGRKVELRGSMQKPVQTTSWESFNEERGGRNAIISNNIII